MFFKVTVITYPNAQRPSSATPLFGVGWSALLGSHKLIIVGVRRRV